MINTQLLKQLYYPEQTETTVQTVPVSEVTVQTDVLQTASAEVTVPVREVSKQPVVVQPVSAAEPLAVRKVLEEAAPVSRPFAAQTESKLRVTGSKDPGYPPALARLAAELAQNYELYNPFVQALINAYDTSDTKAFYYDMTKLPMSSRQALTAMADRMVGLINRYHADPLGGCIKGYVSCMPAAAAFLRGGYAELAAKYTTEKVVRELAEASNTSFEVICNALVSDSEGRFNNEIDILIRLGDDDYYAIETKAGSYRNVDFDKYNQLARRYGLIPDHVLMCVEGISPDGAENIRFIEHYYVVSGKHYEQGLRRMLSAAGEPAEAAIEQEEEIA